MSVISTVKDCAPVGAVVVAAKLATGQTPIGSERR